MSCYVACELSWILFLKVNVIVRFFFVYLFVLSGSRFFVPFLLVFEPIRQTRLTIHVNNVCSDWLATMYFIVQRASAPADHELTCRIRARHQTLA